MQDGGGNAGDELSYLRLQNGELQAPDTPKSRPYDRIKAIFSGTIGAASPDHAAVEALPCSSSLETFGVFVRQKALAASCENGSVPLGPKLFGSKTLRSSHGSMKLRSVEASISERQLVDRVRFLEAENAKQGEQLQLLKGRGAPRGVNLRRTQRLSSGIHTQ